MTARDQGQIVPSQVQRMEDFKHRTLPVVVWSVAALMALIMLVGRAQRFDYIGLAQSLEYTISASADGTIETVVVELFQDVDAGDVVVKLNDELVLASIQTAEATIRQLNAELEATGAQILTETGQGVADWTADLRRFQIDEEQRRLDILALRVEIESDQVELQRLGLELARADSLLDAGLISRSEFDITRLRHEGVRGRIDENLVLLKQTEQEYRAAQARREAYETGLPSHPQDDPLLQPLREAIAVQGRLLREIELQREALTLRSPVMGRVSQILCRRGQAVDHGEPILMIAEQSVQEIVAYLDEASGTDVRENMPVIVSSRNGSRTVAESVVLRISPSIQALPPRLWTNPNVPDYGRAVVIAATPAMDLTPGELVNIKFLPGR